MKFADLEAVSDNICQASHLKKQWMLSKYSIFKQQLWLHRYPANCASHISLNSTCYINIPVQLNSKKCLILKRKAIGALNTKIKCLHSKLE